MAFEYELPAVVSPLRRLPGGGSHHPQSVVTYRTEVYQAQGILTVELGIGLPEALTRLRAHAFRKDQSLAELFRQVMSGEVLLEPTEQFTADLESRNKEGTSAR